MSKELTNKDKLINQLKIDDIKSWVRCSFPPDPETYYSAELEALGEITSEGAIIYYDYQQRGSPYYNENYRLIQTLKFI